MVSRQSLTERFRFACTGCGTLWTTDYRVTHVEDGHGHLRDYYYNHGQPCLDPTAPGAVLCPACGRNRILVGLVAQQPDVGAGATSPTRSPGTKAEAV